MPGTTPRPKPSRGGRPSREAALRLGERILDAATDMLLEHGFAATSIEAVAARAGVSKRTFYHRYADKRSLIEAVVARLVDAAQPAPGDPLAGGADPAAALGELGIRFLEAALSPRIIALHRLIIAESSRFPELLDAVASSRGREAATSRITAVLRQAQADLGAGDAEFAANQFLQLIVSLPQTRALGLGLAMSAAERSQWVADSVRLFLGGVRGLGVAGAATAPASAGNAPPGRGIASARPGLAR